MHSASREAVIWRDTTPDTLFPGMRYLNSETRALSDQIPAGSQLNWCVQGVLSNLQKPDARHCSYKDFRPRHERTVYCHQAVQLLLAVISKHTSAHNTKRAQMGSQ